MVIFHSYVSLPEGIYIYVYTVNECKWIQLDQIEPKNDKRSRENEKLFQLTVRKTTASSPAKLRGNINAVFGYAME